MKDGIVLINKPKGWTSFDVVAKIRGLLRKETGVKRPKVGHTGTLDPMATGLLVIVTGKYTKRAQELTKLDKTYEAELTFGYTSTTDDAEGQLTKISDKKPDNKEVNLTLNNFIGKSNQIPPAFSAIKIAGKRAYKLARGGGEVKLEPRQITIYEINNVKYSYPKLTFTARVSSGTYIRSLARDIGSTLGTGAYLSGLHRTTVGEFDISDAVNIDSFSLDNISIP